MKLMIAVALVTALGLSACEINTPPGAPGPAGAKGASGATGATGTEGAAGAKGAAGAQGDTGKTAPGTVVVVPVPNAEQH
jgi:hypothetical protein